MAKLFAREEKFFSIFNKMTVLIVRSAEILMQMVENPTGDLQAHSASIKELEHKGDELTHSVIDELNKTFITPIDREDIHNLSTALDDVLDLIDSTAVRIVLFKIKDPVPEAPEIARVLRNQVIEKPKS